MNKIQKDLYNTCVKKGIKEWNDIFDYLRKFKKYDNLTYRNIDEVKNHLKKAI